MNASKENAITQPARFKTGQRVVVQPEFDKPYATVKAIVTDVEKGEEDWKYYVKFSGRDHMNRTGGLFFAEEMRAS